MIKYVDLVQMAASRHAYALHADERPGGRLHETPGFTQRLVRLQGERLEPECDEVLYVLGGTGTLAVAGERHDLRAGVAAFVARGTAWSSEGGARAVSVLIHEPAPATAPYAIRDLAEVERETATAGREFLLGATPEVGCASVTQFVGLIPPGRAPDHFHTYDEVIYVLEGTGVLEAGGGRAPIRAGSCIHLPARLVHCLANEGDAPMRVLGVFRPAGSPAEAYYPDGTRATLPGRGDG